MKYNIFHLDLDCFFASVETIKKPFLENKPMVVGGRNKKGVVSSANYEARKYGIKSAMPLHIAKKICKSLIIEDLHIEEYQSISSQIYSLLKSMLKFVEVGSIDEWYLDTTESIYETWDEHEFGMYIKQLIRSHFKINCTVGCSKNKFLAKMATNLNKPNGFGVLTDENFKDKIYGLPIEKMFFIGKKTAVYLKEKNINYIGDIAKTNIDENSIYKRLGTNWLTIKQNVLGLSTNVVKENSTPKTIMKSYSVYDFDNFSEFLLLIHQIVLSLNQLLITNLYEYKNALLKVKLNKVDVINIPIKMTTSTTTVDENEIITKFDQNIPSNIYKDITNVSLTLYSINSLFNKYQQLNIFENDNSILNDIAASVNNKMNKNILTKASYYLKKNYKLSK